MPYDVKQVAAAFVDLATKQDTGLTVPTLQDLLYAASGWHLAITGEPLFNDHFEAWNSGPTVPEIHQAYRACGTEPITPDFADDALLDHDDLATNMVLRIWDYYGTARAETLAEISTEASTPWNRIRVLVGADEDPDGPRNPLIPNETIRKQFLARARDKRDAALLEIAAPDFEL